MGLQFEQNEFTEDDYRRFVRELIKETLLVRSWIKEGRFSEQSDTMGMELEGWIIDNITNDPSPTNGPLLQDLNHPQVVSELSKFNIELNSVPVKLENTGFLEIQNQMEELWGQCQARANNQNSHLLMVGSAPTLQKKMLNMENISAGARYGVLNEQLFKDMENQQVRIHLTGEDKLDFTANDVLPASAATSMQIQWKVPAKSAHMYYNASQAISCVMVALSANSPFIFGKKLWHESRIPLFEHAVAGSRSANNKTPHRRAHFGKGYIEDCISNYFLECAHNYNVLIPLRDIDQYETFGHIALHNGTVWKWNRPVIGFSDDHTPHVRIEHRPLSAGPTIIDGVANAAFFIGVVRYLATHWDDFERIYPFNHASVNFYKCARNSFDAKIMWRNKLTDIQSLVLDQLLDQAAIGLSELGVNEMTIKKYLNIIEQRAARKLNGSIWQLDHLSKNNKDFHQLSQEYFHLQESHLPLHEWCEFRQ